MVASSTLPFFSHLISKQSSDIASSKSMQNLTLLTYIAALCTKSLSWIVLAFYLVLLLLLLPSTIYSQQGNPSQPKLCHIPLLYSTLIMGFHLPQRKAQDFPGYKRSYVILSLVTFSDFILYYFSPLSGPHTLTSVLSLEYAQVLSCLRLLPRIFFPFCCHGSFFPYFSLRSKSTFCVKDSPANVI